MAATSDPVAPRGRRAVPRGFLGMLVLVALGEWLIARVEPAINGFEPWDWRQTGRAATASADVQRAAVLCLGDSLVKLGIQPKVLASGLGGDRSAYNLALCAGRAPASYFLLRRALAAGARPEALVVDFNDSFLAEPPATTLRLYAELLGPGEARELARAGAEPDFAATIGVMQVLPAARNRFEVRRVILDLIQGRSDFAAKSARAVAMRRNWRANLGAQVMPKVPVPMPADPAAWAWVQPSGWRADPTNAAYVAAFFELAEAHAIPVFWLLPPLHPGFAARTKELGGNPAFDAFVRATTARFPRVVVVDGRDARYDPAVYVDMAHLDRDGSARLSASLAGVMADALAHPGPQVVALPPFARAEVAAGASPLAR